MDYKIRFKEILKENGRNGKWFAEEFGISYGYYRKATQNKGDVTNWVRAFVMGYDMFNNKKD